jgi:O-antigen/teichoic acid export membrane protein
VFFYAVAGIPCALIGVGCNYWYLQRHRLLRLNRLRITFACAGELLHESWPVVLSQLAVLIYWNSGTVILGFTNGDEAVGLYGTATRMIFMATIVSGSMMNSFSPVLARAHGAPASSVAIAREYTTLLAWMGLALGALGWAAGGHVVDLLFGPKFHESGQYFEWLCPTIALSFVNLGLRAPLIAWGHQRTEFKINATGAAVNLLVSLWLIPSHGAWGAVAAAIVAELVVLRLSLSARRRIGHGWHSMLPVLRKPLACTSLVAGLVAGLAWRMPHYWWAALALGVVVTAGCVLVFERDIAIPGSGTAPGTAAP